jgi:hypothetical protein
MSLHIEYIQESMDTIKDLRAIEALSIKICGGMPKNKYNHSKQNIIRLLSIPEDHFFNTVPLYGTNPFISAFFWAKSVTLSPLLLFSDIEELLSGNIRSNEEYMRFENSLRDYISTPDIIKITKSMRKSQRKRELSLDAYIDAFVNCYARLTIIRLDLHLRLAPQQINFTRDLLADMIMFWGKFRRELYESKAIPNPMGFVGSLEHGHYRGFHFHVLLIYDGSKYQKDIRISQLIGEHWKNKITNGRGDYHNCNATDPSGYKYYGVGRVDHWNTDKISNLKLAARYLAKTDYSLQAVIDNNRTFFRGNMPQPKKNMGRPRNIPS